VWQRIPVVRLLIPFVAGVLLQWYLQCVLTLPVIIGTVALVFLPGFFFLPAFLRFRLSFISGIAAFFLFLSLGAMLTYGKDIRNQRSWFGHLYKDSMTLVVTLEEKPVEKTNTLKAEASVIALLENNSFYSTKGKIIVYFATDSLPPPLTYGSQIILKKSLQEIKNTGNPGSFDYKQYCLFQDITHQAYLKPPDYSILNTNGGNTWMKFIHALRDKTLSVIRNNIHGEKESGLAEALLIGYKNDLDKGLVQSYTNTGVVHIIAISGLHLGIIYWILLKLLQPLQNKKKWKWLRPLLIIAGLWVFTCIAGAQASVVRSALMFSCIVIGEALSRKANIYNSLALSALLLLCYDPFWIFDVGFQLSYAAVLSLSLFMKPVYNLFYFRNKLLNMIWQLNAVTLAAQFLTLPLSIYYFHQFPNYFLFTNLIAIPLSSVILIGEIILCVTSFIPTIASLIGILITWLIKLMNEFIQTINSLPFSLWNSLQINTAQTILLTCSIIGISYWLINKSVISLKTGLVSLLAFTIIRSISFIQAKRQSKLIVYNTPRKQAIDLMEGNAYYFIGDSLSDDSRNFHLRPSRILHRIAAAKALNNCTISDNTITIHNKRILLLNSPISFAIPDSADRPVIDLLILSQNPRLYIPQLARSITIRQVVADGSVPAWKSRYWKKDCDSLHIPWHDVTTKGAFAMNLR
jgi:competence protein ComEC